MSSIDAGTGYLLTNVDAFAEYTLTVDYLQLLDEGGNKFPFRRMLRSKHVFGAGDKHVEAKLQILPASAQIQDVAEGETLSEDASNTVATTPSSAEEEEKEWYEETWFIVLASVAGAVVLVMGQSKLRHGDSTQTFRAAAKGDLKNLERPDTRVYNRVRRSERFSISNF